MNRLDETIEQADGGYNRYDVYVNGEFVGIKSLVQPDETIADINNFLEEQGCHQFQLTQQLDRYNIDAGNHIDAVKQALELYLRMD